MGRKGQRASAMMGPLLLVANLALADPLYQFDIRGAPLESALRQFADQTGLQISYFSKLAEGRTAPAVFGKLTAEQALQVLLEASGLTFERIDQGTVAIYPAAPARAITELPKKTAVDTPPRPKLLRLAPRDSNGGHRNPRAEGVLEEVVATGSNIRGVNNDTVPTLVLDRQYIERSGFTSMMQLVNALPMNFKGSSATEVAEYGQAPNYGQNLTRGTGFNLHGLGSVSTLTLINGRRVAPSAQGQFVDVSTIPMTARSTARDIADVFRGLRRVQR